MTGRMEKEKEAFCGKTELCPTPFHWLYAVIAPCLYRSHFGLNQAEKGPRKVNKVHNELLDSPELSPVDSHLPRDESYIETTALEMNHK